MKNITLSILLIVLLSIGTFAQTWTPPKHGDTRIGFIGNVWQPFGLIVNHDFGGVGLYATVKTEAVFHPEFEFLQQNFTFGFSIPIFKNAARSNYSDLLVGVSYTTDKDGYRSHWYNWGGEVLLMLPFTDRNFRFIIGWNSNSIVWSEGVTAGFAYQF